MHRVPDKLKVRTSQRAAQRHRRTHVLTEDIQRADRALAPLRRPARAERGPLRSFAVFSAVGALVLAVALPAYTGTAPASASAPVTLQQLAASNAQSLVIASEITGTALDRGAFLATTPEEIEQIKADRAAAARAAQMASVQVLLDRSKYPLTSPGSGEVHYPLPSGSYSVWRTVGGAHQGIDMVAPAGTPIYAVTSGVVRISQESYFGYGVAVVLDGVVGGQRVSTVYAHMISGSRRVEAGETVQAGQLLGLVGTTGRSYGNHLHLEVRVNGMLVEPGAWLATNAG